MTHYGGEIFYEASRTTSIVLPIDSACQAIKSNLLKDIPSLGVLMMLCHFTGRLRLRVTLYNNNKFLAKLYTSLYRDIFSMSDLRLKQMTRLGNSRKCRCEDEHRCNDPFDGSSWHIFTFGLVNKSHSHVPEVKGHTVYKGLPCVCPVLWKLWEKGVR